MRGNFVVGVSRDLCDSINIGVADTLAAVDARIADVTSKIILNLLRTRNDTTQALSSDEVTLLTKGNALSPGKAMAV